MIITALLLVAALDSSQHSIAYFHGPDENKDTRWYKAATYELCPQEHRWSNDEWIQIEQESSHVNLAPEQVDSWDNNGIDFAQASVTKEMEAV